MLRYLHYAKQCQMTVPQCATRARRMSSNEKWIVSSPFSDVTIPDVTFHQYLFDIMEKYGGLTCLINGETGQSFQYHEVRSLALKLGSGLTKMGLAQGDTIAMVSHNCPEYPISLLASSAIGTILTTINSSYTANEIAQQFDNSKAKAVIVHHMALNSVLSACKLYGKIECVISIGKTGLSDVVDIQDLLKDEDNAFPYNLKIKPKEDVVVLPYSSGTTGLPKGVMLTHRNLVANLQQIQHPEILSLHFSTADYQECGIGLLPMYHIYGMIPVMSFSLVIGAKLITMEKFDREEVVKILAKYRPSFFHTVPPLVKYFVSSDSITPEVFSSVKYVSCGAAPVGSSLIGQLFNKFTHESLQFVEGYGMTEASPVTHVSPKSGLVVGSCGVPIPNTRAKIVDVDTGEILGPDQGKGELCVQGPQVMKGYFNNDKATKETVDIEGWLHTGDIAKMDKLTNTYIVDRLKELIKVKGLQVAPAELENLLLEHPKVLDAAVIGIPNERSGEVPRAFIVPRDGVVPGGETGKEIEAFVEQRVAPHKHLEGGVVFLQEIPKTATGKILRRNLKNL